jgi:hypothetical protein
MAPMASIDGKYVGPIRPDEVPGVLDAVRRGEEPLPDRQLERMKSADPRVSTPPSTPGSGTAPPGGGAPWA